MSLRGWVLFAVGPFYVVLALPTYAKRLHLVAELVSRRRRIKLLVGQQLERGERMA